MMDVLFDDVLFLDANVLVSASWLPANVLVSASWLPVTRMRQFWALENVELVTSKYAIAETERSLPNVDQLDRFHYFVARLRIIEDGTYEHIHIPDWVSIREKDIPIIQAAIAAQATYLVTGDARDFGDYFGQTIAGVEIILPADYLQRHAQSE